MKYNEIQEKAAQLGISPVVGVPKKDLEKAIEEKLNKKEPELNTAEENKKENTKKEPGAHESSPKAEYNVAIVMKGAREVRRYTVESHGEDFEKLANEFAESSHYVVKLTTAKQGITCPSCNHVIYL